MARVRGKSCIQPVTWYLTALLCLAAACSTRQAGPAAPAPVLAPMGYAVQVGAFSQPGNALRFCSRLQDRGIPAYYFKHPSGLYKVRFGDYGSRADAEMRAQAARARGLIEDYWIVGPHAPAGTSPAAARLAIRRTAGEFLGLPYEWGSASGGSYDCSGLCMAVYRLNGLALPRTAAEQYAAGRAVSRQNLLPGDLVFFTGTRGRISHVGIYMGRDRFIHAPSPGKVIRYDSLSAEYFSRRFAGARTYLD